jgi:hypothetical protein
MGNAIEGEWEQAAAQMPGPPAMSDTRMGKKRENEIGDDKGSAMMALRGTQGAARPSEFGGYVRSLAGGKTDGYRAAVLSADRQDTAACRCPECDRGRKKPAFRAMAQSLATAGG